MVGRNANEIVASKDINITGTVSEGGYNKEELPHYFTGKIGTVSAEEFQKIYGRELPDGTWGGKIGINDAFCQFYYAKSWLCRLVYKVLDGRMKKSIAKGDPNLDIAFIYNMPIRGISRMTGGAVNMKMVYGITEIANGHFFKGMGKVITGFFGA